MTTTQLVVLVPVDWPSKLNEIARQRRTDRSKLIRETLEKTFHFADVNLETKEVEKS